MFLKAIGGFPRQIGPRGGPRLKAIKASYMDLRRRSRRTLPKKGRQGLSPGARPGRGDGWVFAYCAWLGKAQMNYKELLPPSGKRHWSWMLCKPAARAGTFASAQVLGTWNVISPVGKEPELVREMKLYQLDIVELTSMHSIGSGTP